MKEKGQILIDKLWKELVQLNYDELKKLWDEEGIHWVIDVSGMVEPESIRMESDGYKDFEELSTLVQLDFYLTVRDKLKCQTSKTSAKS